MDPVSIAAVGWGISVSGWLVSPIISELLKKSFNYLGFHSSRRLAELERKVLELKLMLEAAEDSPHRGRLEQWVKDLKSAFYEAQDILDAIEYHELESCIVYPTGDNSAKSTDIKSAFSCLRCNTTKDVGTMKAFNVPAEIRKKLKATIEQIEKLINGHKLLAMLKLPASDNIVRAPPVSPKTTSAAPAAVFGRDGDLEMIRRTLHDESKPSTTKCYSVIGIHGIPGSGKTTLAQYIFELERERKEPHFDLFMWIHVSQNFNVDTIWFEMLEIASGRKMDLLSNPDMLRRGLEGQLSGKRFFLVLDDVWKGVSEQKLDSLLSPLKAGREGSKILVTTRFADAAKDLGAQNLVPIREMDKEQYVSMFMHYALDGAIICDQALMVEKECIGRKIAEKLGGSPLAARTVAGRLRRRLYVDFWRRTLTSDLLSDTMGALWWSYQQLDEPIRQCFTYCSMFPRRYQLDRDELVHLWMAQGFVEPTNATEDTEDVGNDYFEELLSCSFIQSIGNITEGSGSFKIHDLLYDLAEKVAGSDSFRIDKDVDEIPRDVRHLFIESYDNRVLTNQILKLKTLRTLFMSSRSDTGMAAQDLEGLLKGLKKLRVLHVNFRNRENILLPAGIGEMKHLRYLFITGDLVKVILSPAFGKLYHLQKFGALNCCLGYSADKKMSNLINLRYMHTMNKLEFPNVGRLKLLRTLNTFTVKKDAGYEIQQLENLNNIRGHLIIYGLEAVKSKEEAGQANLANKVYISYLELEWCYDHESSNLLAENQTEGRTHDPPEETLEALRPPLLVASLSITNYRGSTYPSWLSGQQGTLENLQHLHFSNCNGSDVPPKLELSMPLRTLSISDCSWKSLPDNMEHLKSLEELNIMSCKNILSLPKLPVSLKRLSLIDWNGSDTPPRVGESLVKLRRLQICSCSWNSLPENMELLVSLEELAIDNCENILLLPRLPLSLKKFQLTGCSRDLMESCRTDGHPNWEKIAHILEDFKSIY